MIVSPVTTTNRCVEADTESKDYPDETCLGDDDDDDDDIISCDDCDGDIKGHCKGVSSSGSFPSCLNVLMKELDRTL